MGKRFPAEQMDPIRRQIDLLESTLRVRVPLVEQIINSCPLLPPVCGFLAGLIIQRRLDLSFAIWGLGCVLLMGLAAAVFRMKPTLRQTAALIWLSVLTGVFFGAVRLRLYQTPPPHDIRKAVCAPQSPATLRGTILTDPRQEDRSRWFFGEYQWTPPGTSFLLKVESALTESGWQPASGTVFATVSRPVTTLSAGNRIECHCRLRTLRPPDNPGMFNTKQYLEDRGIYLSASIPGMEAIRCLESQKGGLGFRLQSQLRGWAQEALDAFGGGQKEISALPETLLLGSRSSLDMQTWIAFQKTGLAHFISLSGMHVGILAGILWWIGRTAGLEKRARALLCLLLIGLYALVVPPRPPTLRAVFLAEFIFLSVLIRRRPQMLNTLALTVLILLLIRPTEAFQPSWQLSYATVLGIVLLYEPLYRHLSRPLYEYPKAAERLFNLPAGDRIWKILHSMLQMLAVGLAAWLGGAGLLLWHFGILTPLSTLWTVLVFPVVFGILLIGFLKLLLAPLIPTLAAVCGVWLEFFSRILTRFVTALADLDLMSFQIGQTACWIILLYYGWLFFVRFYPRFGKFKTTLFVLGAVSILFSLWLPRIRRTASNDLTVTCLSVGHGLAVVAELPGGRVLLFDAGSISVKNPGGRIVTPFLQHRGIETMDLAILSHGDLDHYNGLPEVLSGIPVKAVFANPGFLQRSEISFGPRRMKTLFQERVGNFATETLPPLSSPARLRSLWPDAQTAADPSVSDNDKSEVLLIEHAGKTILLCGDIEEYAQEKILALYPDLNVDVLLLPHHGSRLNILPGFLRRLDPSIRIVSCSANRLANTVDLDDNGTNWYTPLHGAVRVTIKADGTLDAAGFLD